MIAALIVALVLVFGFVTMSMGKSKGRSGSFWWGFFLGIIGVIVVATQKDLTTK
jgi:uncharacterized membrane protein YdcZ (DUF606 family)